MKRRFYASLLPAALIAGLIMASCNKTENAYQSQSAQPFSHSSMVLDKWMSMQLRLMRNATGIQNQAFSRHFVYAGVAALESLSPGLPAHTRILNRWNGLSGLPVINHSTRYYYPANVNAALAAINKSMFPNASVSDKNAIDSLETALKQEFLQQANAEVIQASAEFGKAVATAVYNWSETDGYKNASMPYTPPVGPGFWVPTAPAYGAAASPYWGNNRTVITGSTDNSQPDAPVAYSTHPGSAFYMMVKQVYDASQTLTNEQKAMAMFWRDVPGVSSPGHWLSILQQAIREEEVALDKGALAYALVGAAINDALISAWQTKYQYNLVRPITYIRDVMGFSSWTSYLGTPPHPECTSAHSVLSAAAGEMMENLFDGGSFTDHTYDYLGFVPRTYSSFRDIGEEAGQSRLYAGIHYQPSIDAGLWQGKKVAENILAKRLTQ